MPWPCPPALYSEEPEYSSPPRDCGAANDATFWVRMVQCLTMNWKISGILIVWIFSASIRCRIP